MSSTSGTKNMAGRPKKISLSADEICKIIAECRSANVAEINFQGLHIVFQSRRNETAPILGQGRDDEKIVITETAKTEEASLMNDQALLDAEDAQILIDDPLAFEKLNSMADIERNRAMDA